MAGKLFNESISPMQNLEKSLGNSTENTAGSQSGVTWMAKSSLSGQLTITPDATRELNTKLSKGRNRQESSKLR
eukprot:749812-Hanusia_phi.AAC.1